ncbi:MAG: YidH family protein [Actinomycetales bacterium]
MRWDWRRELLRHGEHPDPRFTLANERTFLAWIRTSLALTAGGIALDTFTGPTFSPVVRVVLAVGLLGLGSLLAIGSFLRWYTSERNMRHQQPLNFPLIAPVLAAGVGVAGIVMVITLLSAA